MSAASPQDRIVWAREALARAQRLGNLLAGSLAGAWVGAGFAVRIEAGTLRRVIAALLSAIAMILLFAHNPTSPHVAALSGGFWFAAGLVAGFGIGVVAALLGVAGANRGCRYSRERHCGKRYANAKF